MDKTIFNNLSDKEKELALKILNEFGKDGVSKTYTDLLYEDYREIPVDIETFLTDDRYMGQAWKDAEGNLKIFPFWMQKLKELFPNNVDTSVNTFIASGARGLGKTEIAMAIMDYLLHRIMCLKNPLEHFHLKPSEKIVFAIMNIKLDLAEEIRSYQRRRSCPW